MLPFHNASSTEGRRPLSISDFASVRQLLVDSDDCRRGSVVQFNHTEGLISAFTRNNAIVDASACYIHIQTPPGTFLQLTARFFHERPCLGWTSVTVETELPMVEHVEGLNLDLFNRALEGEKIKFIGSIYCQRAPFDHPMLVLLPGNSAYLIITTEQAFAPFWVYFRSSAENRLQGDYMDLYHYSQSSGCLSLPGFHNHLVPAYGLTLFHTIHLPQGYVVMLSFPIQETIAKYDQRNYAEM
jgi:hypothetical protein